MVGSAQTQGIRVDELAIDVLAREVRVGEEMVDLTLKEFDLMVFLVRSPRRVFSRRELLEQVWNSAPECQHPATVTVHIGRLRTKLEYDRTMRSRFVSIRGIGYRFDP